MKEGLQIRMENIIFKEMNLSHELQRALSEMGFEEATPIQTKAIPPIFQGKDIIGQAQTGTGKTCAFGIPAIEMLDPGVTGVQVLVLCPTRELAIQVSEELKNVSRFKKGVKVLPIYGGQSIDRQILALKSKPQIIIGTPGRVMDHMRRHTLKLANLRMIILDEADEMLNMGFREDIDTILKEIPEDRQTLLFSATIPGRSWT
jgi:ATP-dependent RNA helicase DeaD